MKRVKLCAVVFAIAALTSPSTAVARTLPLFTIHQNPGSAHAYQRATAPNVTVDSASWWRYSTRYSHLYRFVGTLDYDTQTRTVGVACVGEGPAIWQVEAVRAQIYALVECDHSAPGHHVILGPGAARSFEGWQLPTARVMPHDRLVVDVVVDAGGGTSALTLGLVPYDAGTPNG